MSALEIPIAEKPLFFLDYDGTLAPIVDDPLRAVPHPDVPQLLETLNQRFPLWIVTGRFLADIARFLDHPYRAIGLHGMQEGRIGGEVAELISDEDREALTNMRQTVPHVDGLHVESKGPTFALHYRHVRDEAAALAELDTWLKDLPPFLEVIRGKKVYEIRPRNRTKGTAVTQIADEYPDYTPVYLGDDVTDEDAFQALARRGGDAITIKIGDGATAADVRLAGPDDVVRYLMRYLTEDAV